MNVPYVKVSLVMHNMPYAFEITAMVLIEQLSECLAHKPPWAASMSAAHVHDWAIVRKLNFLADKRRF